MSNKGKFNFGVELEMEILSNREVVIDGCKGVAEFDENFIKINAPKGAVTFFGADIEIKSYTECGLIIVGRFERIEFCM